MRLGRLFFTFLLLASAQEVLTNEAIVKLVKGGVGEDVIVSLVQSQAGTYTVASDELVKLKQLGLTDKILAAMIAKASKTPGASSVTTPPPPSTSEDGKLPFLVGHWHVGFGCHSCDSGQMFVTRNGIEFRGGEHSFKWSSDDIREIASTKRNANTSVPFGEEPVEAVEIKVKGDSRSFLFVECSIDSTCRHPATVSMLRLSLLGGLGRLDPTTAAALKGELPAPTRATIKDLGDTGMLGSKDAPITIVEYTDYQCPFCQRFHAETFPDLKRDYIDMGRVRFFSKDLPLDTHKNAMRAAMAAQCAGEQNKFWELRDRMIQHADRLEMDRIAEFAKELGLDVQALRTCVNTGKYKVQIANDIRDAKRIGADGTPTFIIGNSQGDGVDGDLQVGAITYQALDETLKKLSK